MVTPVVGSLSFTGNAPIVRVDTRMAPGETGLSFASYVPLVTVDTKSLIINLPSMLATFTERRRLIRATTDPVRDLVFQSRHSEMFVALELDGEVFDTSAITDIELVCEKDDGTSVTVTMTDYPAVFDFSTRAVVRGKTVNVLRLVLTDATIAALFTTGLWSVEIFGVDADHPGGALWGAMEWEIRALFDGVVIVPNTGEMNFTEYAPTVRYDRAATLTGEMAFAGTQPRLTVQSVNAIYVGELTMTGYAPVLSPIAVPTGALTMGGIAPVRTP